MQTMSNIDKAINNDKSQTHIIDSDDEDRLLRLKIQVICKNANTEGIPWHGMDEIVSSWTRRSHTILSTYVTGTNKFFWGGGGETRGIHIHKSI